MKFRGGLNEMMRQAGRLQRKIEKRREELKEDVFEASVGNGQVKAVANGGLEIVEMTIDPALLASDGLEMVQDLVVAAANAALTKAREHVDAEVDKITGGMNVPGM